MNDFIEVISRDDDETWIINIKNINIIKRSTYPKAKCDIYTNTAMIKTKSSYEEIKTMLGVK